MQKCKWPHLESVFGLSILGYCRNMVVQLTKTQLFHLLIHFGPFDQTFKSSVALHLSTTANRCGPLQQHRHYPATPSAQFKGQNGSRWWLPFRIKSFCRFLLSHLNPRGKIRMFLHMHFSSRWCHQAFNTVQLLLVPVWKSCLLSVCTFSHPLRVGFLKSFLF